jgi:hypothetical protein
VKEILKRKGPELAQDVKDCVACLQRAEVAAHARSKIEQGWGVLMVEEDPQLENALTILRAQGFDVVEGSKAFGAYEHLNRQK